MCTWDKLYQLQAGRRMVIWWLLYCLLTAVLLLAAYQLLLRSRMSRPIQVKHIIQKMRLVQHPMREVSVAHNFLDGKTAIITGANTGMGLQTAINLAHLKARVILGCRNSQAGNNAVSRIIRETGNENVINIDLDLASFDSIKKFANLVNQEEQLDILINNAGVFMLPLRRTSDNIEMHFGVNYLGHFLLTNLLLEKLKMAPSARIVNIASSTPPFSAINFNDINSEHGYNRVRAVLQSKQSVLLYTKFLSGELRTTNATVNSVDPGLVMNEFGRNRDYWYGYFQLAFYPLLKILLKSPEKGCLSAVYCATSPDMEGITGKHVVNSKIVDTPLPKSLDREAEERLYHISRSFTNMDQL